MKMSLKAYQIKCNIVDVSQLAENSQWFTVKNKVSDYVDSSYFTFLNMLK